MVQRGRRYCQERNVIRGVRGLFGNNNSRHRTCTTYVSSSSALNSRIDLGADRSAGVRPISVVLARDWDPGETFLARIEPLGPSSINRLSRIGGFVSRRRQSPRGSTRSMRPNASRCDKLKRRSISITRIQVFTIIHTYYHNNNLVVVFKLQ